MDIYKAIKMEKKSLKRFYKLMVVLAIILPLSVYLTQVKSLFYLVYLIALELLIIFAIIVKLNYYELRYKCSNNKLHIKNGIFTSNGLILCDKVILVHTEGMEATMDIILITTMKVRNKGLRPITKGFLKKYPNLESNLNKINKDGVLYYQIVRFGGLNKYLLLDTIYKNCVKAMYTDECIQNIKIARGQTLV